jgi:inner membrane protein
VVQPLVAGGFGFLVGTLSILSHLLADVVTPAGIAPLWPLSGTNYSLDLARADSTVANYALLALGVFVSVALLAVTPGLFHLAGS